MVCDACEAGTREYSRAQRERERTCVHTLTCTHVHTHTHTKTTHACMRTGVSEACARQAKGRRGASNGFAALQNLEVGDDEVASGTDEEGASGTAAGQRQEEEEGTQGTEGDDEKRGTRAEHPALGAERVRELAVQGLGWAV